MALRGMHEQALAVFRGMLGDRGVVTDPIALQGHNFDWFDNRTGGKAAVVLTPASTAEVSQVLAYCNSEGIPVVPQGAALLPLFTPCTCIAMCALYKKACNTLAGLR